MKEQTEQNTPTAPEKATKKAKEMTDEDVKAMLRRYYSDVDTLPQEKEPAFEFDTSEFVEDTEPEVEPEVEVNPEPEVEPEVETEPEKIELPAEESLEEIINEEPVITDETESHFELEEDVQPPEFLTEPTVEEEPVVEETPIVEEEPVVEETPIVEEEPVVEETPVEELQDQAVLPDEEDLREWRPADDVSGRSDDGELDLMVALGLGDRLIGKYGDERVRRAQEKLRLREEIESLEVNAHAYVGNELTPRSDLNAIRKRYRSARTRSVLRLCGTLVLTLAVLFFEELKLFGLEIGVLANVSIRTSILSVLLIGCAAISYRRVAEGALFALGRRRSGNVLLPFSLLIMLVYNLMIIVFSPQNEPSLFNLPISLAFLFEVTSELFDVVRQRQTFEMVVKKDGKQLNGLLVVGNDERDRDLLSAERIDFVEGYFRRSSDNRSSYPVNMLFTVLPLAAAGALVAIISTVAELETIRAVSAFPAIFAFAAPLSSAFGIAWQRLRASSGLAARGSAVLGAAATDEYMNTKAIVFSDGLVFPSNKVTINNIKIYDNSEIYKTIYTVNALFEKVGGPLREVMHSTAANLGEPKSVRMIGAADHYVEALVDKKDMVCAGSLSALESRGVDVVKDPNDSRDGEDGCVMYAAINGVVCARFCLRYELNSRVKGVCRDLMSDGVGVRIRTLDPNIDRALLVSLFGENADVGIRREPARAASASGASAATSVVSRSGRFGLADALIVSRRLRRGERAMLIAAVVQIIVGVAAASAAVFLGVPGHLLSPFATVMQLLSVLPAAVIYSLNVKR